MKKITMLVAVIMTAVVAQAASFKWSAANIYGSDGVTKWSGDVQLYAVIDGVDTLVNTPLGRNPKRRAPETSARLNVGP